MTRKQRSNSTQQYTRRPASLALRQSFIIFCEGQTEVGYFSSFRKKAKYIAGGNALKIVENAIAFKNASEMNYDQYWAVFDKDETTDQDFARAIELAEANNIHAAWSNQAFECWIILHFREFKHSCHRNDYEPMLRQYIPNYSVSGKGEAQGRHLHGVTILHLSAAVSRAKAGHASFDPDLSPAQKQTCTLVYQLIESILKTTNIPGG
jgi:RloB-like protein